MNKKTFAPLGTIIRDSKGEYIILRGQDLLDYRKQIQNDLVLGRIFLVRIIENSKYAVVNSAELAGMSVLEIRTSKFGIQKNYFQDLTKDGYSADLAKFKEMPIAEKARSLCELRKTLVSLKRNVPIEERVPLILDTLRRSYYLNATALCLKTSDLTGYLPSIKSDTVGIVSTVLNLVKEDALLRAMFNTLHDLSNGQTVNHILRVTILTIGYIQYFNEVMGMQSITRTIDIHFKHWRNSYIQYFPGQETKNIKIFNTMPINKISPEDIIQIALGALLHDLGKFENLDYFEGNGSRDLEKIQQHAQSGHDLIMRNYGSNYSIPALIAGLHHEYHGHSDGYGILRPNSGQIVKVSGRNTLEVCVSNDFAKVLAGSALSYFPAELVAIVDVYHGLLDKRGYHLQQMQTSAEALAVMAEAFVQAGKLDPILVDIFADYLGTLGEDIPPEIGLKNKLRN